MKEFRDKYGLPRNTKGIYLWTESGALLHAKSIRSDRAWDIYNELLNAYFRLRESTVITYEQICGDLSYLIGTAVSKINELTRENTRLKLMAAIDNDQQKQLQEIVRNKILDTVGGDAERYKIVASALNSAIWAMYRRKFHLDSFRNTPQYLFDEATGFLENWQPSEKHKINKQKNSNPP